MAVMERMETLELIFGLTLEVQAMLLAWAFYPQLEKGMNKLISLVGK
ncbi:MAG: hypothetical protein ABIR57_11255 [Aeromicrobium sp.]